jgi:hypothetical protein
MVIISSLSFWYVVGTGYGISAIDASFGVRIRNNHEPDRGCSVVAITIRLRDTITFSVP